MPFKCNHEEFEKIYEELYKAKISHKFIRNGLGLSDSVWLKLNGTFGRDLYLLDEDNKLYNVEYRIQTALWINHLTGKKQYVSIFPNFIKRYCPPSLHVLEYVSCQLRKGEDIFRHIDDPEELLYCEDCITGTLKRLEKECIKVNYSALLNSRYTEVFNRIIATSGRQESATKRYSVLHSLIVIARRFFGEQFGVLALVNTIIPL